MAGENVRTIHPETARRLLKECVKAVGPAKVAARELNVDPFYLYKIVNGHRPIPDHVARQIGLVKSWVYLIRKAQYTENQARAELRRLVVVEGMSRFAKRMGVSQQYIYGVLNFTNRLIGPKMLKALHWKREPVYFKADGLIC